MQTQHLKDMQIYRNQLNENRARYQTLMTASQPDMKAVYANIEERAKIRTEMEKKRADHVQAIRQILTDEQRVYFDQHAGNRKGFAGCGYGAGCRHGFGRDMVQEQECSIGEEQAGINRLLPFS
jgi:hypothetical protein